MLLEDLGYNGQVAGWHIPMTVTGICRCLNADGCTYKQYCTDILVESWPWGERWTWFRASEQVVIGVALKELNEWLKTAL